MESVSRKRTIGSDRRSQTIFLRRRSFCVTQNAYLEKMVSTPYTLTLDTTLRSREVWCYWSLFGSGRLWWGLAVGGDPRSSQVTAGCRLRITGVAYLLLKQNGSLTDYRILSFVSPINGKTTREVWTVLSQVINWSLQQFFKEMLNYQICVALSKLLMEIIMCMPPCQPSKKNDAFISTAKRRSKKRCFQRFS